jgi:hypothetical protein
VAAAHHHSPETFAEVPVSLHGNSYEVDPALGGSNNASVN